MTVQAGARPRPEEPGRRPTGTRRGSGPLPHRRRRRYARGRARPLRARAASSAPSLREVRARGRVRGAVRLLGPAFVASVAYVDPGNFATNFAGGEEHGYRLVWVVVLANAMAIGVQYLASKLGLATGRSLPELCRQRYGRRTNLLLWLQAEAVAMATDLAEFVGAAIGLHLLVGVPLLPAGLITAVVAFGLLELQRRGRRPFELAVVALLALVGLGFGYIFVTVGGQSPSGLAAGLIPNPGGGDGINLTVAIVGATVMPHVVYLHSDLSKDRIRTAGAGERRTLLRFDQWDCGIGLGLAGVINLLMLCAGAALGAAGAHSPELSAVHGDLARYAGGGAALAFAVALMASGLSSAGVGTYAGQVVMGGFLNRRIPLPVRRAVTMLPSLVVLSLTADTGQALVGSQIALSFGIPFALVPLLLLTRDSTLMGDLTNRPRTTAVMTAVTTLITALNLWLLYSACTG